MKTLSDREMMELCGNCRDMIVDECETEGDVFKAINIIFNMLAYTHIASNPQARAELGLGKLLDGIRQDMMDRADAIRLHAMNSNVRPS